ncbi:MAG: phosphatidylserine decarboxylase [Alteromonadaceae bacterium]|nr:phosphatidylserine decarboxylase [Alteromonadaceae bacterium]
MLDKLFVFSQYLTPQLAISHLAGRLADSARASGLRHRVIKWFIGRYGVNMNEAAEPDFTTYPTFNAFFTRALKEGVRPIAGGNEVFVSPVDGTISQLGQVSQDRVFQAKGQSFSLLELLGGNPEQAEAFTDGEFATLYLSPSDYHRIHMPMAGTLREMVYVPGKLFSVNPTTAAHVPNLFARNERVVCLFDTDAGPLALVLVGAMIVGSVETTWAGIIAPNPHQVSHWQYDGDDAPRFEKGEEMGRFRLGSTVIAVMPRGAVQWNKEQVAAKNVRLGEAFGQVSASGPIGGEG